MNTRRTAALCGLVAGFGAMGALSCGSRPEGVPVSLRLWLSDTAVAQFRSATGLAGTVSVKGGASLELTPSLDSGVLVVGVRKTVAASQTARDSRELVLRLKRSRRVRIPETSFELEWLAVDAVVSGASKGAPCTRCCITCSGVTVCACVVSMPCGTCACARGCAASMMQPRALLGPTPTSSPTTLPPAQS